MKLDVREPVLKANDDIAADLRRMFRQRHMAVVNLISSPGAGKTTLLERTLDRLRGDLKVAVLVGDVQTENDAHRLERFGFAVQQIITGGTCHLEARMIAEHLPQVLSPGLDLLLVENVGNLVCPTDFDLGEDAKVVLLSTPEGEDKPLKYPAIFHRAAAAVLTKIDLLPYVDCNVATVRRYLRAVHPGMPLFEVSAVSGQGLDAWLAWLQAEVQAKRVLSD